LTYSELSDGSTPYVPAILLLPWLTGVFKQRNARLYFGVGVIRLGIDASRDGGLRFAFPVAIVSGVKP
jgi:hypothetical protein